MEEDAALMTREQYVEMLIDASCWEASEMESGFLSWCQRHVPIWREQGSDEIWIRQRVAMALRTRALHRTLKHQGLTMQEIREELRKMYTDAPQLYDLARTRARLSPGLLLYRGNTGDLRQRYTLRVLLYETDKRAFEQYCRWRGLPVPGPESVFREQPDQVRVVRDLSTVEELELALALSRYALHLFDTSENPTPDQIASRMKACSIQIQSVRLPTTGVNQDLEGGPILYDQQRVSLPLHLSEMSNRIGRR